MPLPILAAAGIAAGAGIIDSVWSGSQNRKSQEKINQQNIDFAERNNRAQREWERQQMDYENAINRANWDASNAYNTPAEQVRRMKEANLNPALMYGSSPSNTTQMLDSAHGGASRPENPQLNAPRYDSIGIGAVGGQMLQAMQFEQQKRMTDANVANTVANTLKTLSETPSDTAAAQKIKDDQIKANLALTGQNVDSVILGNNLKRQQSGLNEQESQKRIQDLATQRLNNEYTGLKKQLAQKQLMQADVQRELSEFELKQRKMGINPNDPAYYKDAKKLLDKIFDFGDLFEP